ncbi:MAG: hypothetical protein U0842_24745 [Candidatus Binatia bacterium]|jgi:hypothetical protein
MTPQGPRDLRDFAREIGYAAVQCPDCRHVRVGAVVRTPCANCGGSGRLWSSARGSLDDRGLARLHRLHAGGIEEDGA